MASFICAFRRISWQPVLGSALLLVLAFSVSPLSAGDGQEIGRLIQQLGSAHFREREAATNALRAIGESSLSALRQALESKDPEIRQRAKALLLQIDVDVRRLRYITAGVHSLRGLGAQISLHCDPSGMQVYDVRLDGDNFGDDELIALRNCDKMASLYMVSSQVTDRGLAHIENLSSLEALFILNAPISDLRSLHRLTNLGCLNVTSTKITDAGLAPVKNFTKLLSLNLSNTDISDPGLIHLRGLKKLRSLSLSGTKITDAGLVHLRNLKNLRNLTLSKTKVTDAGLVHLKELPQLRMLLTSHSQVTKEGIELLKETFPDLNEETRATCDIEKLIVRLRCPAERAEVMKALRTIGQLAVPALRRAEAGGEAEVQQCAKALLAEIRQRKNSSPEAPRKESIPKSR